MVHYIIVYKCIADTIVSICIVHKSLNGIAKNVHLYRWKKGNNYLLVCQREEKYNILVYKGKICIVNQ